MWTKRCAYITESKQLQDYLKKQYGFHDFIIGSFSFDSQMNTLDLTIEEDYTLSDVSNAPALVWNLSCQGVSHFVAESMDGLSKWWLSELLFDGEIFQVQLVNGYFSFKATSFSFGIPHKTATDFGIKISRIQLDYLLQEIKARKIVNEITFAFESDSDDLLRFIGVSDDVEGFYWLGLSDSPNSKQFKEVDELFNAKIYDGKSLKERWSEVIIYGIADQSLDDWLTFSKHSVDPNVFELEEDGTLFINGVELDGFIDEDSYCKICAANQCYLYDYDEYFCPFCNYWLHEDCWDKENIHYFKKRPLEPALLWKPNKKVSFCQVVYHQNGKPYTYYCPDESISEGDWVSVPVGKQNLKKEAQVIKVFQSQANIPPFPLNKIKAVSKKLPSITQEVEEIVNELSKNGLICDLSKEKLPADSSVAYDLLKTPVGHFWLELNHQPIKMFIETEYPTDASKYFVEGSYFIKPNQTDFQYFKQLCLCTDIDFRSARMIDNLNGEHQDGYNWQVKEYDIGLVSHPYSYLEDEVSETSVGLPLYVEWYESYKHLYGFSIAWKYYISDEDLSVYYNV
ncbi:hypothetical protein [Streptococcus marimammalium]|uniref:hypothetical protein n=1 Tax=Streptococcus marimammalium TaxID=269666 RepID=UPI00035E6CD0|nr:hypothetical protein [Streptococcus marimammalium]